MTSRPAAAPVGWPVANQHRDLATLVAAFAARLRASGVPVTTEQTVRFAAAVELARPAVNGELYWLGRVTLLDRFEQIDVYDAA